MSDEKPGFLKRKVYPWFHFPGTYKDYYTHDMEHKFEHVDNIWHHFHIFDGYWIKVQQRKEWYESPNVPGIYADHKYIFKQNMGIGRPEETFYSQNVDDGGFKSVMEVTEKLPSGRGDLKITTTINTKSPPSGENDFCLVEYLVDTEIKYELDKGITFLPRLLASPINRFFKWGFFNVIGEEMVDRDGEYARERTTEYFQYIRKYHGEEPTQTKTRQAEFKPVPEEGIFFQ